jgi:hypothetical protein
MTRQLDMLEPRTLRDDKNRKVVATIGEDVAVDLAHQGLKRLGSVHGHRFVRLLVHRAYDAKEAGDDNYWRLRFVGGKRAVAEAIGLHSGKYGPVVDELLTAGLVRWETPHIAGGGLWTWTEARGSRAGPGVIEIQPSSALLPGLANELASGSKTAAARRARRLVPELRHDVPTGILRNNEQGAAWTLHRLMLLELVDSARELHETGYVDIPFARWGALAKRASFPRTRLTALLESWTEGESDDAPALIERSGDGVTLAAPHALERDFIAAGGERREQGRKAGRKGRRAGRFKQPRKRAKKQPRRTT